jgi:hypothetical protein
MPPALSPRTAIVLALVAATSAACSAAHENMSSSDGALVINPIGSEHESHITLQLPTDACQPGATCAKVLAQAPSLYVDGTPVVLGASTRLKPGHHNVAVNNLGWQVTTNPDQNMTVVLPVVDRKCTNASLPNVPKTDFGGSVSVSNAPCPTTAQGSATGVPGAGSTILYYYTACSSSYIAANPASSYNCSSAYSGYNFYYTNSAGACVLGGLGPAGCAVAQAAAMVTPGTTALTDAYQAFVPGTITATVNNTAQSLTLNPGDEVDFDLSLPALGNVPSTFETDLTFLDPRANPDAAKGTITSSCSGDATYTIPSETGTPAPLALHAFVNTACAYTLSVGGRSQILSQASTNGISLHRIDVNDVTITREDGTTYTTKGTYTLNYGGVQVVGPYSTGTGIDVLSGTYEFSLTYTDFDGVQTQTQTITL